MQMASNVLHLAEMTEANTIRKMTSFSDSTRAQCQGRVMESYDIFPFQGGIFLLIPVSVLTVLLMMNIHWD